MRIGILQGLVLEVKLSLRPFVPKSDFWLGIFRKMLFWFVKMQNYAWLFGSKLFQVAALSNLTFEICSYEILSAICNFCWFWMTEWTKMSDRVT